MSLRPLPAKLPVAVLSETKPLKALLDKSQQISHLQRLVETQLQPAAREHCHVASWQNGCLLLIVTDGHWATRLRYQQRRLEAQLLRLEEFSTLTKILFKVQPRFDKQRQSKDPIYLSDQSAQSLQETADSITDPKLKASLERLAKHTRKPN